MDQQKRASFLIPIPMLEYLDKVARVENKAITFLIRRALAIVAGYPAETLDSWERRYRRPYPARPIKKWTPHREGARSAKVVVYMPTSLVFRIKELAQERVVTQSWLCVTALMPMLGIRQDDLDRWAGGELPKKGEKYPGIFQDRKERKLW